MVRWLVAVAAAVGLGFGAAPAWADATLDGRLQVRDPVVLSGLAVYLVVDPGAPERPTGEHVLLADAIAQGTLTITEVDAGGSVPVLMAHNRGDRPVLAMAGDVVNGGKQDRVVTQDVLIPKTAEPQPIAVNCVEQSRWNGANGLGFSYGGKSEVALKKTVQMAKDQGATWAKVSELNDIRGQAPETGTYRATLTDAATQATVDAGLARLATVQDPKAVGVVVAVKGTLETAEIYDNPAIFGRSRSELLRSIVLDAAGQQALAGTFVPPSAAAAADWVSEARKAQVEATVAQPASAYIELDAPATKSYELRTTDGKKVKETIYKK